MNFNDINIRDPFILPFEGKYYMYGSRVGIPVHSAWGEQTGFDVYISEDLENWSAPLSVFELREDFWGTQDSWAPEVHRYNGRFYMLASFKAEGKCRGTQILAADSPEGPFAPITEYPVTPADWECLDGTLYIDNSGKPHIVFCHEWQQIGNGTVCEMQLSDDLTCAVSAPRVLWCASVYPDVKSVTDKDGDYVTDGPFLFRGKDGDLFCIWSSFNAGGYTELVCKSNNGDIDGEWSLMDRPLSSEDGGHGMIFRDFSGNDFFIMHRPNTATLERPVLFPLHQDGRYLSI